MTTFYGVQFYDRQDKDTPVAHYRLFVENPRVRVRVLHIRRSQAHRCIVKLWLAEVCLHRRRNNRQPHI